MTEDIRLELLMVSKKLSEAEAKVAEARIILNKITSGEDWKHTNFDVKSFSFPQKES